MAGILIKIAFQKVRNPQRTDIDVLVRGTLLPALLMGYLVVLEGLGDGFVQEVCTTLHAVERARVGPRGCSGASCAGTSVGTGLLLVCHECNAVRHQGGGNFGNDTFVILQRILMIICLYSLR